MTVKIISWVWIKSQPVMLNHFPLPRCPQLNVQKYNRKILSDLSPYGDVNCLPFYHLWGSFFNRIYHLLLIVILNSHFIRWWTRVLSGPPREKYFREFQGIFFFFLSSLNKSSQFCYPFVILILCVLCIDQVFSRFLQLFILITKSNLCYYNKFKQIKCIT